MEAITVESAFNFFNQGWVGSMIGLTGILIGAILSLLFFLRSKRKANPSVQFSRMTILSPRTDELPDDVQLLYKGNEIKQLSKTNIILWNDGTETLHGSSVVEGSPIRVAFEEGENILRHQIVKETRPVNRARLELVEGENNAIDIKFDYFDPNDGINIEILHDSKDDPKISGTIRGIPSGIRTIKGLPPKSSSFVVIMNRFFKRRSKIPMILASCMGLLFFGMGALDKFNIVDSKRVNDTLNDSSIIMGMGLFYAVIPLIFLWLFRKRYPKELND